MKRETMWGALALCLILPACAELPVSGPRHDDILMGAATSAINAPGTVAFDYALVDLNEASVNAVYDIDADSFLRSFGKDRGAPPKVPIGAGDVLQLTIFESKSGGLFIPVDAGVRPGNYVTLPPQTVDVNGKIAVPYAGDIQVAGRSVLEVQRMIEERLANRAIEPKVIISINEEVAGTVSVVGEVNLPKKVKLTQSGERILDVIAFAGGPRYPGYEIYITVQRKGRKATMYFNSLVLHPEENIYAVPGDTIYLYHEPRRFVAFGAVGVAAGIGASSALSGLSGQFNFDQERVSLAEGVAKAGGLLDAQANPGQVFVYRMEARNILKLIGVDLEKFPPEKKVIPTVYRANFRDPSSYFFAQRFPMRNKDVLYVSNAESVEVMKFLNFVNSVATVGGSIPQSAAAARHGGQYVATGSASPF
ncbi:MAG: polysaccharide biosynthesis/export family protein [Rhodomicrobium sp.]